MWCLSLAVYSALQNTSLGELEKEFILSIPRCQEPSEKSASIELMSVNTLHAKCENDIKVKNDINPAPFADMKDASFVGFTFNGGSKQGSQRYNALILDDVCKLSWDKGLHYRWVPVTPGEYWTTVSNDKLFAEGWGWEGIAITGNGNLAGRGLIKQAAVRRLKKSSVTDWYVVPDQSQKMLNFYVAVDHVSQGPIFQLKIESDLNISPGVAFGSDAMELAFACESFPLGSGKYDFAVVEKETPGPTPSGIWSYRQEEWDARKQYTLEVTPKTGSNYILSTKVGNSYRAEAVMNPNGECQVGAGATTRMMPPEDVYRLETGVFDFLSGAIAWKRSQNSLILTAKDGTTHTFDWYVPNGNVGPIKHPF